MNLFNVMTLSGLLVASVASGVVNAMPPAETRAVQLRLLEVGYNPGDVDSMFGAATSKALAEFQHNNGLPVTGEMDEKTSNWLDWHQQLPAGYQAVEAPLVPTQVVVMVPAQIPSVNLPERLFADEETETLEVTPAIYGP